jgi:ABC-2 type transport system ATP-binding protein
MEEVQTLCSRIGIIDHGRLIACDTLPALLRQLQGFIRFRVTERSAALKERLHQTTGCRIFEDDSAQLELECPDVKATLVRLIGLLNELQLGLVSLETEEPNLERVFLHLTGRGLRD